ncbi:hypothetical protein RP20_CCG017879 [Aedes albopictus]|nr:hypothetical protein RP20_CCG017879 [Aedes albopictus]
MFQIDLLRKIWRMRYTATPDDAKYQTAGKTSSIMQSIFIRARVADKETRATGAHSRRRNAEHGWKISGCKLI